jgi:hypothetical protein
MLAGFIVTDLLLALPALVWVGIESFELNYNRRTE